MAGEVNRMSITFGTARRSGGGQVRFGNRWACLEDGYDSGYTSGVKTAISLPDPLFEAAEQLARQLGKSRSQLYAEALREYLERRRGEDITRRLNEIYDAEPELAELDPGAGRPAVQIPAERRMVGAAG
jgi:predicted DNA-binding protein